MRWTRVAALGVTLALAGCSTASAGGTSTRTTASPTSPSSSTLLPTATNSEPSYASQPAPYVDHVRWVTASGGRSLRVYPTKAGRTTQGPGDEAEAWSEVLRMAPDADQPGMRAQFDCHWTYARLAAPDKPSWNLEPWRPVVSSEEMTQAACNPGGPELAES
jgi:Protein of unknown function (DUF2599)